MGGLLLSFIFTNGRPSTNRQNADHSAAIQWIYPNRAGDQVAVNLPHRPIGRYCAPGNAASPTVADNVGRPPRSGIVDLSGRGMLVVSVARQLGSGTPLLAYHAARPSGAGPGKAPWVR
jgi:hypothetical protein